MAFNKTPITQSFTVHVRKQDGTLEKLDFTQKMATKATMKVLINNVELENKENQQILLNEYNGKVDVFLKADFEEMLNNNDISTLNGYNSTAIGQLDVHSQVGIERAVIPNFDIQLTNGRIKDILANETSTKMAQVRLRNQKKQYERFDESADSFIPWKTDLTGKKTAATGSTGQNPTEALDKYISAATTAGHNTVARAIKTLNSGTRKIKLAKSELSSKGNFLKVIDKLIFYKQKIGVIDANDSNAKRINGEGSIRRIGGTSRSEFTIFCDYDVLHYFTESGTFFIANTGNKLSISPEVGTYRGVKIIPKLMGKRDVYIVDNNSWTLQSFAKLSTKISGDTGLLYKSGKAGSLTVKELLPSERLLTIDYLTRWIEPDKYSGPIHSIEFV